MLRNAKRFIYVTVICTCFLPFMSPAVALFIGLTFSIVGLRHENIHKYTSKILQASIVLMGFGMSLSAVISSSKTGFLETIVSVTTVMIFGILLGKLLKVEKTSHYLLLRGQPFAEVVPLRRLLQYSIVKTTKTRLHLSWFLC